MDAGFLSEEKSQAHRRMLGYLPIKSHTKMTDIDKAEALEVTMEGRRKPVIYQGVEYRSIKEASVATGVKYKTILREALSPSTVEPRLDGIPIFKGSTTSKPSKAVLRRREREAAK